MTSGFPPNITCSRTSFSNWSFPLFAIISYEMRSTYWKLSAVSTKVRTSKSGGMGSKEARGRAAGIVCVAEHHQRLRFVRGVSGAEVLLPRRIHGRKAALTRERLSKRSMFRVGASINGPKRAVCGSGVVALSFKIRDATGKLSVGEAVGYSGPCHVLPRFSVLSTFITHHPHPCYRT
jgi:hypothetical protein